MSLIDELKALHADSLNPSPGDDERRDSSENFEFIYALADAWPNILTLIKAAIEIKNREEIGGFGHEGIADLLIALAALDGVGE